ncbi:MAG: hypothetical protein A4E43_00102 [Methanosaeta sp. PtaB.Bin005]|nr:MAG: hypothetical protein A4E43_00102 [Methanosaeta sp. PtaB.Bin005]
MVPFIERLDSLAGPLQQVLILWHNLLLGIDQVGQEAEVKVVIPVCQVSDLKPLQQVIDLFRTGQN